MSDSPFTVRWPKQNRPAKRKNPKDAVKQITDPGDDDTFMAQLQFALTEQAPQAAGCCAHKVNDQWLLADPQGVAFWESASTLIVADLHLEKGTSFARRGQLLPPYDTDITLARLETCLEKWKPKRVIALGDSFHDPEASARLSLPAREKLKALMKGRDWVWITGNHDPQPPEGLGGESAETLREDGLIFRHEPQVEDCLGELAGHLHPKAKLVRRGRHVRRSCFAANETRMILPSFGAYTGGLNVLDQAYAGLFEDRNFYALMRGEEQVYRIAGSELG